MIDIAQLKPEQAKVFLQWCNEFLGDIMKKKPETDYEIMERDAKKNPAVKRMLIRNYGEQKNE